MTVGDAMDQMRRHKFLFLSGVHRSGTTLFSRVFAEHPEVSGFENTGAAMDEGQHLQDVFPTGEQVGGMGRFGLNPESHIEETSPLVSDQNRARLWASWSKHWNLERPILSEKSPPNIVRMRFFQAMFPNAYFIVLVRHPIAVTLAHKKWRRCRMMSVPSLIRHWLACHEKAAEDAPRLERVYPVSYERFVASPAEVLAEMCAFLGVESFAPRTQVRAEINDKYNAQWERGLARPIRGFMTRRALTELEPRVNRFGYSLREPGRVDEAALRRAMGGGKSG